MAAMGIVLVIAFAVGVLAMMILLAVGAIHGSRRSVRERDAAKRIEDEARRQLEVERVKRELEAGEA